ncbi:MAG: 1-(5-phosphoribosyl)-5-[(5-phosphoribosylamino)methylideneamino] imidazole-4-carboxamide isomerase [Balneolales bacterium]|nr:1-(5-phosphoribosyl)-5-[(5-phosphoribosylamino)methylideneamino] imidazole-4-carboxamide isomerase [Balneolales bacterium]
MLTIPAIDLLDGKIVRLEQGDYNKVTLYHENPVKFALSLAENPQIKRLHIVDLDGAREGSFKNLHIIEKIVQETPFEVQTGGGIRSLYDIETLMNAGVKRVVSSSMALKRQDEWFQALDIFGPGSCIFGMDLKDGKAAAGGWLETSDESLENILYPMMQHGLSEVLCTDINRDGMMNGPNIPMYQDLGKRFPDLRFIASGGVSSQDDLHLLEEAGLFACVVGRSWLEGIVKV